MNQKKKLQIPGEVIVAVILVALIIGGVVLAFWHDRSKRAAIAGTYMNEFQVNGSSTNSITVYYRFDSEKGTYEEAWGDSVLMTGTYTVDGDTITVVTAGNEDTGAESETLTFLLDDDKLIPEDYIYEGELPDGETFDAVVSMKDSAGMGYEVTFSKDGSFTYLVESGSGTTTTDFTYKREGNYIHRFGEDGTQLTDFYIYKGRLAGIFYVKTEE